jgi:transcription termination factor NusB
MSEILYDIEISKTPSYSFVARMKSRVRPQTPIREYQGEKFEEILEQLVRDILDENED